MLRLVLIGSILMIAVIVSLAGESRVTPRRIPGSFPNVTQRAADPPMAVDLPSRWAPTRPFVYQPCRTMMWATRFGACREKVQEPH